MSTDTVRPERFGWKPGETTVKLPPKPAPVPQPPEPKKPEEKK